MSDLTEYINRRKESDKEFASGYDVGYEKFKSKVILKELRIQSEPAQEELEKQTHTKNAFVLSGV
jgi:hypothetical protein